MGKGIISKAAFGVCLNNASWRQYFVLSPLLLLLLLSGCATEPGAGTDRAQIFGDSPAVALPVRVVLDHNFKMTAQGTVLNLPAPSDPYGGFGLSGDLTYGAMSLVDEARKGASLRSKFLVGEALESAIKRISYSGSDNIPTIRADVLEDRKRRC